MKANHLTLNLDQTKTMYFGTKYTLSQILKLNIKLQDTEVEEVQTMKYLGVIRHQRMTFSEHAEYILGTTISRLKCWDVPAGWCHRTHPWNYIKP